MILEIIQNLNLRTGVELIQKISITLLKDSLNLNPLISLSISKSLESVLVIIEKIFIFDLSPLLNDLAASFLIEEFDDERRFKISLSFKFLFLNENFIPAMV